jgi:dTDP-4-dehydrorhamnose reductase
MKVLIFGATGLLGKALVREWTSDEVEAMGSRDVDIRDSAKVREIMENARPDWIVLAAAYTDVDGCESHRELAFSVNRDGAVNVAEATRQAGAKLIFLSSDYVFDGKKTSPYEVEDKRNPQSVYGHSKAEAEINLLEILPRSCIARTSWVFGVGGRCFRTRSCGWPRIDPLSTLSMISEDVRRTRWIWREPSYSFAEKMPAVLCM